MKGTIPPDREAVNLSLQSGPATLALAGGEHGVHCGGVGERQAAQGAPRAEEEVARARVEAAHESLH